MTTSQPAGTMFGKPYWIGYGGVITRPEDNWTPEALQALLAAVSPVIEANKARRPCRY